MIILFPGRHQLLTNFQFQYLDNLLAPGATVPGVDGRPVTLPEKVDAIVFAVTSANHSNTRRNPLAFYLRALSIELFARGLDMPVYIYGIDDVGHLGNFADYTLKRIRHESEGLFDLTPANTWVLCSTPVLDMYEKLGFTILPAELTDRSTWQHNTALPWDVVETIAGSANWREEGMVKKHMHVSSLGLWERYRLANKVQLLFRDKMISDDGDITTTRDYNTYVRQMDNIAALKYEETSAYIQPGRVGDIGCAVGSWIRLACADIRLRESDFYGIEVARHLFDICQQRKHNGEFSNPFVFFSQRNAVTGLVFDRASMNTIHTSSLTHEIESYGSRAELLQFIANRYQELVPGGVWVNRDVVGPADKDAPVLMKLNDKDGQHEDTDRVFDTREALADYLNTMSTYGRFLRFARDFRKKEGYTLAYEIVSVNGEQYIRLSCKDACEFMSRKDYTDNWESEMHETFCFWDFGEWKDHLEAAGFRVKAESHPYVNKWIAENRLAGKVELFGMGAFGVERMEWPVMGMIMVAEKSG